ncbi:ATP-dependent DNA helicase Hrp3, partial [Coemansia sp. RSA 2703]
MQANGISSVSTNGGGLASPETNGQTAAPYSAEDRGINGAQDTQQAQEQAAEQTQAQPQRRRLVQGRPSHGRVVSDTNSDLSSASSDEQASDSDFGEYGSKEANGNRPQVAMKAPRANPAAAAASIADRQAPQQQATAQRVSNFIDDEDDESSVSEMSVVSEDADFTMSGVDDIEEDLESSSESSALEDDSSDGNWGSKARKRKPKKTKAGATNKRAKNGGRKGSRGGSSANASQHGTPRVAAKTRGGYYSDSDDSDFLGGGRRKTKLKRGARAAATKKTKGGVPAYLGGSDSEAGSSDYRSVRQSSRGGGVKSYAEDQGDYPGVDFEDSADEEIEPKAKAAAKQAQPLIDEDTGEDIIEQVRDFRLSEKAGDTRMDNIDNLEFFIKWKGWSYRHSTWDTAAFLRDYKGYKKVENYFKGTVLVDNAIRNDPATTREDIEQLDINREMERDTLRDYTKVERVVASRPLASARRVREGDGAAAATATQTDGDGDGVEYLVKWRRLPYSACSWVAADELGAEAQAELDAFLDRSQSQQVPHRSASTSKAKRPKFQRLTQQPA